MTPAVDNGADGPELLAWYRQMLLIRRFEEALGDLFARNLLGGTSHFCIGQEACAVGVMAAVRPTDYIVSHHRGHGHLLARGLDPVRLMSELLGRQAGYCRGRGGSQHLCALDQRVLGTNGITGGGIPIGTGAAFALKYRGADDVVVTLFGDGASNQGTFHESLNMASLWRLPALYVCENNGYAMSQALRDSTAGGSVAARADAYRMRNLTADGMDVARVRNAVADALAGVRAGDGPALVELTTYRFCGHSRNDPRVYRTREEEAAWQERDCLRVTAKRLHALGTGDADIAAADAETRAAVAAAVDAALRQPPGDRATALEGVYA